MAESIIVGSRGSPLALKQTEYFCGLLKAAYPTINVEIRIIKTTGDRILNAPLTQIGGKGIFVKEIEEALLCHDIDIAVHSMKDVPTELPKNLILPVVLKRTEYRDALVSQKFSGLSALPPGAVVGTSSFRRKIQILRRRPDLTVKDIRGNVDTRLKKMDSGEYQALVMSAAGMERLGWGDRIREYLDFLPAPGQGALALEIRKNDHSVLRLIARFNDACSARAVRLERFFLEKMGGGCQAPIGAYAEMKGNRFVMKVFIGSLDGKRILEHTVEDFLHHASKKIEWLSQTILENGGKDILKAVCGTS